MAPRSHQTERWKQALIGRLGVCPPDDDWQMALLFDSSEWVDFVKRMFDVVDVDDLDDIGDMIVLLQPKIFAHEGFEFDQTLATSVICREPLELDGEEYTPRATLMFYADTSSESEFREALSNIAPFLKNHIVVVTGDVPATANVNAYRKSCLDAYAEMLKEYPNAEDAWAAIPENLCAESFRHEPEGDEVDNAGNHRARDAAVDVVVDNRHVVRGPVNHWENESDSDEEDDNGNDLFD